MQSESMYSGLHHSGLVYTSLHLKSVVFWSDQKFKRVQISCSVVSNSLQPHELQHTRPPCPSPTPQLPEPTQTHVESVMPSNHLILCRPLLLLLSIFPSITVFSSESVLRIRWPKYWSFSFNISPSNEYSGLISFRMDWLDTTERIHFHFSLSCIGEGNGNPFQCSCLENPRDGEAWWAAVYGVAQSRTRLKWLNSSSMKMDVN